jgi:hypothetical protein
MANNLISLHQLSKCAPNTCILKFIQCDELVVVKLWWEDVFV